MITLIKNFFTDNGNHVYICIAYSSVIMSLLLAWIFPWRRWQKYVRDQKNLIDYEHSA